MLTLPNRTIKVFISYSHDSREHKDRVLALSDRLRKEGVDCLIDQHEMSPLEGWPAWTMRQIEEADFVIMVCTKEYNERVRGRAGAGTGLGAKWEGASITQELYENQRQYNKYVPITLSSEDEQYIPLFIRNLTHYNLSEDDNYECLYRYITGQPNTPLPELGKLRPMRPRERKQVFSVSPPTARGKKPEAEAQSSNMSAIQLETPNAIAVQELTSIDELTLQSQIVEPLLREMGFRHVQDTSGSGKLGKELIAIKPDEFGLGILYTIKIKKFRPSANLGSINNFGRLLDKLIQSAEDAIIDPITNEKRCPDWCWFITPYPLPDHVKRAFHRRMMDPALKMVRIIDGPKLVEQIHRYTPEVLTLFSMETQYRLRVEYEAGKVRESAIAFELNEDLKLDDIYVDASLSQMDSGLEGILKKPRTEGVLTITVEKKKIKSFCSQYKKIVRRSSTQLPQIPERTWLENHKVDLDLILAPLRKRTRDYFKQMAHMANPKMSKEKRTQIISEGISIKQDLSMLRNTAIFKEHWDSLLAPSLLRTPSNNTLLVSSSLIFNVDECLFVIGSPGAGKTTLLRRLSQELARGHEAYLPLFLPLMSVNDPSYEGIINACLKELNSQGFKIRGRQLSRVSFISLLRLGKFRFCFDGLDEAGSKAQELMAAIDKFVTKHRRCKVILSSRETFELKNWDRAFTVYLTPFSDRQLKAFVTKWFSSQPSAVEGLMSWLSQNQSMKEAARTPLMAALLCSLFQVQADMPSTEVELYERRFELLLGRWDQAKRIQPLRPEIRKRYFHFLMNLAFSLHKEETRFVTPKTATRFAEKYYIQGFHHTPDALVMDCVRRGLLEQEENGTLSFGHLTYQEFLTAEWLVQHNPTAFIWKRILSSWWDKTLTFFATKKLDITPLVKYGLNFRVDQYSMESICRLVSCAPLTSKEALSKFCSLPRAKTHI